MEAALITLIAANASTGVYHLAMRASTISAEKRREVADALHLERVRARKRARQADVYIREAA